MKINYSGEEFFVPPTNQILQKVLKNKPEVFEQEYLYIDDFQENEPLQEDDCE